MLFGCMSGMVVGVALQPLEIIKSNIIINPQNLVEFKNANIVKYYIWDNNA
jgi:hypothetical protein